MASVQPILVVDDDVAMCQMLVDLLRAAHFEPKFATGVQGALRLLREEPFTAVLSDVHMWPRDGFDLLREVLALGSNVRVILMSSFGSEELAREATDAGAFAFIAKPFDPDELAELLSRIPEIH